MDTFLKQITGVVLEEMLEFERDDYLGYSRYDSANKKTKNSRNGYSSKTARSIHGEMELDIPRDGDFEPELIKKYQRLTFIMPPLYIHPTPYDDHLLASYRRNDKYA